MKYQRRDLKLRIRKDVYDDGVKVASKFRITTHCYFVDMLEFVQQDGKAFKRFVSEKYMKPRKSMIMALNKIKV